ncbi:MAG: sugar ABC transporter ATP-binding protein [bacterium]|nr:sugar ABC transporter ATP-binding protein [bacterium]MDY4099420.1 sugar ABC transporter ATP-binding protein [Lachnospiraceae bacterium]
MKNITKEYPGVKALDDVSISFEEGEVHALVGENGAGKSTFIKTISGAIRPTLGTIVIGGKEYSGLEPAQAIELGVAVVYQEMIQFEAMTVADNIFMGMKEGLVLDDKSRCERAKELLAIFDSHIDPNTKIRDLSMANRQIVELTKAVVKKAKIIIMDEPTASITMAEQEKLYGVVQKLKADGITVIYISHRLEELFQICDRVSVLRDGKYVTTIGMHETDKDGLIRLMVGRELSETYPKKAPCTDEVVLEVEHLSGNGVEDISFQLHKGEILGFAGLVGAGRTELMEVIYGAAKKTAGVIRINGKEVELHSPSDGMANGIGLIPEDRKYQGCFLDKSILWNISISNLKNLSKATVMDRKKETEVAEGYKTKLRIKTPSLQQFAGGLSGGNQQKVVLAKALAAAPDILIFDEPTRGIDVGARYEIYMLMNELAEQGKSILMVSSDMEELLGMSERIVVLHEGQKKGEIEKEAFSQELVLQKASGM